MCTHKGPGWNPHAKPYPYPDSAALVLVYGSGHLLIWELSQGSVPQTFFTWRQLMKVFWLAPIGSQENRASCSSSAVEGSVGGSKQKGITHPLLLTYHSAARMQRAQRWHVTESPVPYLPAQS